MLILLLYIYIIIDTMNVYRVDVNITFIYIIISWHLVAPK